MGGQIPFHDQQVIYGVSEDCKYNDHPMCRSPRCGCSCHRQARVAADNDGIGHVSAAVPSTGHVEGLDKYCPTCNKKAPSTQFYCKVDGIKLSSLRCPECQTPGDQEDAYCGHCGCSMKVSDRRLEAAATGQPVDRIAEDQPDTSGDPEAAMRAAMAMKQPGPKVASPSKISVGMFK